jgi:hypothetical protein
VPCRAHALRHLVLVCIELCIHRPRMRIYTSFLIDYKESMAKTIGKPIAQANSSYVNQRTTGVSYSIQISFTWTLGYVYADWSPPLSDLNFAKTNLHRFLLVVLII